jgi:peptide/nickel transport system substrate-binding protein
MDLSGAGERRRTSVRRVTMTSRARSLGRLNRRQLVAGLSAVGLGGLGRNVAAAQESTDDLPRGGTIVLGTTWGEIPLLNPLLSADEPTDTLINFMMEPLLDFNPADGMPRPLVAESWSVSEDGKVYTFKLKPDITFHDGQPLTTRDVMMTFEGLVDPATTSPFTSDFVATVEGMEAPDDHTFVFKLKQPSASFIAYNITDFGILPAHLLSDVPHADWPVAEFNSHPIGSGPFMFAEYRPGEFYRLTANPNYHRGAPLTDELIYKSVPDSTVLYQQLKTGEVDYAAIDPNFFDDAEQQTNFTVFVYDKFDHHNVGFNLDPERTTLFQQPDVRHALAHAADRQSIVDGVLNGLAQVPAGLMQPASWAYQPEKITVSYPYDPERAKQLLDAAGWTASADGIREKDGQRFAFSVNAQSGEKVTEGILTVLQDNWKAVGVEMTPIFEESAVWVDRIDITRDFDAILSGGGPGVDPDWSLWFATRNYKNGFNFVKYSNPRVDELLEQGRLTTDIEERKRIYAEFENVWLEDLPWLVIATLKGVIGINKRVKNLVPNAIQEAPDPHLWYIEE